MSKEEKKANQIFYLQPVILLAVGLEYVVAISPSNEPVDKAQQALATTEVDVKG